jgi:hypothetical protein
MYMKVLKQYATERKGSFHYLGRGVAVASMNDRKGNLWCVIGTEDRKGHVARPIAYLVDGENYDNGDGTFNHEGVVATMLSGGFPLTAAYGLDGGRELRKLLLCERFTRPDNDGNPIDAEWYVELHAKEGLTVITRDGGRGHVPDAEELEGDEDGDDDTSAGVIQKYGFTGNNEAEEAARELIEKYGSVEI